MYMLFTTVEYLTVIVYVITGVVND